MGVNSSTFFLIDPKFIRLDILKKELFLELQMSRNRRHCFFSVDFLKKSPVKRHHSTGDMLAPSDLSYEQEPALVRQRRPKSEGSFYVEKFRPKRASSFGVNNYFPCSGIIRGKNLWSNSYQLSVKFVTALSIFILDLLLNFLQIHTIIC